MRFALPKEPSGVLKIPLHPTLTLCDYNFTTGQKIVSSFLRVARSRSMGSLALVEKARADFAFGDDFCFYGAHAHQLSGGAQNGFDGIQ